MQGDARVMFREMAADDAGGPANGPEDLGVRIGVDIRPDFNGNVHPGRGGMSVAPDDPMHLHPHHRPPSLFGTGTKPVWQVARSALPILLSFRPDPKKPALHGFVEPATEMLLLKYEGHLHETAPAWSICGT